MNVPLFPAPPALGGAATSLSDVPDVATPTRVPAAAVSWTRKRDVVPKARRTSGIYRKRPRACRNLVHPKAREQARGRVTEFRVRMTERRQNDEEEDDDDVICAIDTPTTVSEEISPTYKMGLEIEKSTRSLGIQTIAGIPLRLRVLPSIRDIVDEENSNSTSPKKSSRFWRHLRFLVRMSLSQFGLLWLLTIWALVGAAAFCATEGPRELEQVVQLKDMQKDLAVGLAMELRQLRTEQDQDVEPLWRNKVQQYVAKHEQLLLMAINSGYGESGNGGQLWTFPGCVLFAISLLTTLGFGAPVPRTTAGRIVAVVFAAIGIPAHFLLVLNLGILLAVRLQRYAIARRCAQDGQTETSYSTPVPKWVKVVPFVCTATLCIQTVQADAFLLNCSLLLSAGNSMFRSSQIQANSGKRTVSAGFYSCWRPFNDTRPRTDIIRSLSGRCCHYRGCRGCGVASISHAKPDQHGSEVRLTDRSLVHILKHCR